MSIYYVRQQRILEGLPELKKELKGIAEKTSEKFNELDRKIRTITQIMGGFSGIGQRIANEVRRHSELSEKMVKEILGVEE